MTTHEHARAVPPGGSYEYATTAGRIRISDAGQSDTVAPDPKIPGPSSSDTTQDWSPWHLMSTKVTVVDRSKDHADNLVLIVWTWMRCAMGRP